MKRRSDKKRVPKKHGMRYPWAKWFALPQFKLVRGSHYTVPSFSMGMICRQAARRHGVRLSIRTSERHIVVSVLSPQKEVADE